MTLRASFVVVAGPRSDQLHLCLTHLEALTTRPHEIVVVDASQDGQPAQLTVCSFPHARFLHHPIGPGKRTEPRRLAWEQTDGDVVVFIDDDVIPDTDWLEQVTPLFRNEGVAAVGGRLTTGTPKEEVTGLENVGRLLPDGRLTYNFSADPGRPIEVDHLSRIAVAYRRAAVDAVGGIRGAYNYAETTALELTDAFLRLRQAGGTLLYQPAAVVRKAPTPSSSERVPLRHRDLYYARRNHLALLLRVYGWREPVARQYVVTSLREQSNYLPAVLAGIGARTADGSRRPLSQRVTAPLRLARIGTNMLGLAAAVPAAIIAARKEALPPRPPPPPG